MSYKAPLRDMQFVLYEVLNGDQILPALPGYEDATREIMDAMLTEGAKLSENVLAPLNASGDREGCQYDPETKLVTVPKGFKEAYKQFAEAGWTALASPVEYGGQGLPHTLNTLAEEMVCSANLSLGMYPGLTHGAINALTSYGTDELKETYLPRLISGEWTGTMCLTEPQCGTDLGLIRTKAEPQADGSYAISGTKIWITGGEHDMVDNIIHLVLAKLPDAPASAKGISLFLVPKFLEDGSRNPAFCGGLEHKMGIKGSATCVMNFEQAKGWLIGEPNKGLQAMFVMMNSARLMVGLQGLGIAEAAYQTSLGFAKDRLQSRSLAGPQEPEKPADSIIVHPDVRRMLLRQKATIEGSRAMAYFTNLQLDIAHKAETAEEREQADDMVQLLTPVVKAFLTDEGFFCANDGLQLMGGAGFTQDWPLEQYVRDSRITRIYEGTNGIQALDLVGRKLGIAGGRPVKRYFAMLDQYMKDYADAPHVAELKAAKDRLQKATMWLMQNGMMDREQAGAAATPYLRLFALTTVAYFWSRMAKVAQEQLDGGSTETHFYQAKIKTAHFFMSKLLPQTESLLTEIEAGKESLMALDVAEF
ncbi:MAG: acyl-CoA dehydrogenase C-terminal domain-containing protein [Thalassolituus sp.]|jgi:alkylation response protein AidB-like acyl-CoA dehydrogenase|uniref:Acyl-CoA dehydrogenase n=1 Tax=hydrothermal vent metagenome TaxID=652676 RepID=A0A160TFL0_9ZZZZ|nr:acyl-CoA dehydrogenase C-terminal domain-containing protein [Thalassolituus oleivorans]PCI46584.1 MAG: acyl-CoA dehydrogenase [Oceanospirillales bacterium]PHQ85099.1 MAG: acyl-CoA dehydrogenase [Thalassobium sp.]AHK15104.1 acyl-CoA dehydrogenase [Thalassolituus oleivorans R6-15]APR66239.1 acyl-CoA dehydrogenase [Thalassolituus oleivorans]MDF1640444.1 acyl-CoA dehydrogenase C-terminal domain-containing protein [Thalassolituus oleivorans]